MSQYQLNALMDRAADLVDELSGHPSGADKRIIESISNKNWEELYHLVVKYEAELAQANMKHWGINVW